MFSDNKVALMQMLLLHIFIRPVQSPSLLAIWNILNFWYVMDTDIIDAAITVTITTIKTIWLDLNNLFF